MKAVLRCQRCGDAIAPAVHIVPAGESGSMTIPTPSDAYDGPCISDRDGSVEEKHRYVQIEFTSPLLDDMRFKLD
jgi:hypothetical protein